MDFLSRRLGEQKEKGLLRGLSIGSDGVDFASNDYLGFSRKGLLTAEDKGLQSGSTGSRLITGHSKRFEEVELTIAQFHSADSGLIYNSGYDANVGLISALVRKEDVVLYDELSHASIYDGVRLSKGSSFPFRHNDLRHLKERLEYYSTTRGVDSECFVVVESVYSMDGDLSPLKEIAVLCQTHSAKLIVDEAHATGVFGDSGKGMVVECELVNDVFARVHTFGKALGCHGAIVLGSKELRTYLINFSRSFIYTTALPPHSVEVIDKAYSLLKSSSGEIEKLHGLIDEFRSLIKKEGVSGFIDSKSPIQSLVMPGNENVRKAAAAVQKAGFDVRPILSPTVPRGSERIRICLHAFNSSDELKGLVRELARILSESKSMAG